MKLLLLLTLTVALSACSGSDTVIVNTHGDRISELERRADLNDKLNEVQNMRLDALEGRMGSVEDRATDLEVRVDELEGEVEALELADADLQQQIDDLTTQMLDGDASLQSQIDSLVWEQSVTRGRLNSLQAQLFVQSFVVSVMQNQISIINSRFPVINSRLNSLQSQINDHSSRLDTIESELNDVVSDLSSLDTRVLALESDFLVLEGQVSALQARLDREGVTVFKCNSASSKEKIFKINGLFYAAMNYVTKSGNNVTSVQIALESLNSSTTYVTTDGGPACTFKGDGTNLIPFNL
jgi:chromosome segregation ATPase